MPPRKCVHVLHEALRTEVGVVVGDQPDWTIDAVNSEEGRRPVGEGDDRCRCLDLEGLGVGEA